MTGVPPEFKVIVTPCITTLVVVLGTGMITVVAVFVTKVVDVTVDPNVVMNVVVDVVAGTVVVPVIVRIVPEVVVNCVVGDAKAGMVIVIVRVVVDAAPTVVVKVDNTVPGVWTNVSDTAPGDGNGFGSVQKSILESEARVEECSLHTTPLNSPPLAAPDPEPEPPSTSFGCQ